MTLIRRAPAQTAAQAPVSHVRLVSACHYGQRPSGRRTRSVSVFQGHTAVPLLAQMVEGSDEPEEPKVDSKGRKFM